VIPCSSKQTTSWPCQVWGSSPPSSPRRIPPPRPIEPKEAKASAAPGKAKLWREAAKRASAPAGGKYDGCYQYFEQIFTAFHRQNGDVGTTASAPGSGKHVPRPPRPDATHVNAVMGAVVKMLEEWCQVRREEPLASPSAFSTSYQ
jgi:hypothetical protein